MRTCLRSVRRWLKRQCHAAGAWHDVVELMAASALCALLEGWWRLRYSDAMTMTAARLTLALLPIAPLALAAATGHYLQAHVARLRRRRAATALYRVLGGDMTRAACVQALSAMLRLATATAGGMLAAWLLLPLAATGVMPSSPLSAVGAFAAGLALALHAAWQTWQVPAAYDLAASAADDVASHLGGEPADDIGERLRMLYAASPLLTRRRQHPAARYRYALNPLLLVVYVLLIDKHRPLARQHDDDLAQADDRGDTDIRHHAQWWQEGHDGGAAARHTPPSGEARPSLSAPETGSDLMRPHHPQPGPETDAALPWLANRGLRLPGGTADNATASHSLADPARADPAPARITVTSATVGAGGHIYGTDFVGRPPHLPLTNGGAGSLSVAWSASGTVQIATDAMPQEILLHTASTSLSTAVVTSSAAGSTQVAQHSADTAVLTPGAANLALMTASLALSQGNAMGQLAQADATQLVAWPAETGTVHTTVASEPTQANLIILIGQALDGHVSTLHIG